MQNKHCLLVSKKYIKIIRKLIVDCNIPFEDERFRQYLRFFHYHRVMLVKHYSGITIEHYIIDMKLKSGC